MQISDVFKRCVAFCRYQGESFRIKYIGGVPMNNIIIRKKEKEKRFCGGGVCTFSAGYLEVVGCDKITAFYEELSDNAMKAVLSSAGDGRKIFFRIIPRVRYESDERADITLDIIFSENGKLKVYKRIAQSWRLSDETLAVPIKKGAETFFDGEKYVEVINLFGKEEKRRMSEYINEIPIKTKKRRFLGKSIVIDYRIEEKNNCQTQKRVV